MNSSSDTLSVEVKILDERIHTWGLPKYQSAMAAGIDLFACTEEPVRLEPHAPAILIASGISVHIGNPHVMGVIVPRSGLGHKKGIVLGNTVGILDADYTGPLMISVYLRNPTSVAIDICPGDRIAQLIFVPILRPTFTIVDEFSTTTERGGGGFGSTGHTHQPETTA